MKESLPTFCRVAFGGELKRHAASPLHEGRKRGTRCALTVALIVQIVLCAMRKNRGLDRNQENFAGHARRCNCC